jgi:hypothetical protein
MSTGRVYISRDVVFDENVFTFASLRPNASTLLRKEILLLPSSTSVSHEGASNVANHVPIVPITNVLQVAEHATENFRENGVETPAENEVEHISKDDENGSESDADSADISDPEADLPGADSPSLGSRGAAPTASAKHTPSASHGAPSGGSSPSLHVEHAQHTPPPSPAATPGHSAGSSPDASLQMSAAPDASTGSSVGSAGGGDSVASSPPPSSDDTPPRSPRTRLQKGIR